MRKILVETTEGIKEENIYTLKEFPFDLLNETELCRTKRKIYYNISAAFDIETTNVDGIKNDKGEYTVRPFAFMYHWQFCLDRYVIFGRTWEQYQKFFRELADACKAVLAIYVHNLAFEYQFMKDFIDIKNMFAKAKRRPLKFDSHKGKFEWRCSYFLSNMGLAKFCENCQGVTHYKLSEDRKSENVSRETFPVYDYSKIRTPRTEMTMFEESYCFNDVYGLCECIRDKLREDTIATIPLTSTGYVRRDCREAMAKNPENRKLFQKMALTKEQYIMCKEAFRGGDTHANRQFSGKILASLDSEDMSSAYPSACELDYFPMGKFTKVSPESDDEFYAHIDKHCCLFRLNLFDVRCHEDVPSPYIPIAKCNKFSKVENDNGRVLSAVYLSITVTELDFLLIEDMYDFESFSVEEMYIAPRGRLPYELREIIMEYFRLKTELKGIEGKEYEYMKAKNKLNAIFGMMVTAIDHSEVMTDGAEWWEETPDIEAGLKKYYASPKSFLSYQWGLWVTAHVRYRLNQGRAFIKENVYNDTDSLKGMGVDRTAFEQYNAEIRKQCEENDIPLFAYNKKGEKCYMMVWDHDAHYIRFKTLGAKKYVYEIRNKEDKIEFHITISGVNKKKGAKAIGSIERFEVSQFGTALGKLEDVGRTVSYYNESDVKRITYNADTFTTASNCAIIDTTYELGITDTYYEVLRNYFDISSLQI